MDMEPETVPSNGDESGNLDHGEPSGSVAPAPLATNPPDCRVSNTVRNICTHHHLYRCSL